MRGLLAFWIGGAGAAPTAEQGGTRSLLAPWIGGASAPAAAEHGGTRSMLAPWIGGASAATAAQQLGTRGLMAFWMGGAAPGVGTDPEPPIIQGSSGGSGLRARLLREDEELLALLAGAVASGLLH